MGSMDFFHNTFDSLKHINVRELAENNAIMLAQKLWYQAINNDSLKERLSNKNL